jgi:hypothetical protein
MSTDRTLQLHASEPQLIEKNIRELAADATN